MATFVIKAVLVHVNRRLFHQLVDAGGCQVGIGLEHQEGDGSHVGGGGGRSVKATRSLLIGTRIFEEGTEKSCGRSAAVT